MLKRTILALALCGVASAALAQGVNQVPQVGTVAAIIKNPTYTASAVGLVPASSATDIFCISPGTTRNISIKKIKIGGSAGTAITTPFIIYKRASLDTGGTAATGVALPVGVAMGNIDPASTATLTAYTANPTVNDSSPKLMDEATVSLATTTSANAPVDSTITYGTSVDWFSKSLDLGKNTTTQICVNLNAASVSSGVLNISMQWQETN